MSRSRVKTYFKAVKHFHWWRKIAFFKTKFTDLLWEREREERVGNRLCTVSTEANTGLGPTNCEIGTWAEIKSWTLNRLIRPRRPRKIAFERCVCFLCFSIFLSWPSSYSCKYWLSCACDMEEFSILLWSLVTPLVFFFPPVLLCRLADYFYAIICT